MQLLEETDTVRVVFNNLSVHSIDTRSGIAPSSISLRSLALREAPSYSRCAKRCRAALALFPQPSIEHQRRGFERLSLMKKPPQLSASQRRMSFPGGNNKSMAAAAADRRSGR